MKESEAFFAMMGCAFSVVMLLSNRPSDGDLFTQVLRVAVIFVYTMYAIRFLGRWLILIGERMQKSQ